MADENGTNRLGRPGEEAARGPGQRLVLALVISVTTLAALGLTLVWLNIERTKLAYRMRVLQHEADERVDLNAKLSVEREHLLSPRELGKKAELMGLGPAKTGQIRRLDTQTESNPAAGAQGARQAAPGIRD